MRSRSARGPFSHFLFALVIGVGVVGLYGPRSGWAVQGHLENPSAGSFQSGIGVISGWVCTVNSAVEIQIDDSPKLRAAYGTTREDVHNNPNGCPQNANSGFGLTFNWNLVGEGAHTIRALADGVEIGKVEVIVARLSDKEFLPDLSRTVSVPNFPQAGHTVTLQWQESNQNFALTNGGSGGGGGGNLRNGAFLENPSAGSFQSGIGVISGWVCTVNSAVEIQIDDSPKLRAAYGTTREDVHNNPNGCPQNANSGFGLTFNWNLVGGGVHRVRAFADGTLFADITFTVTTLGLGEFPQGLSGEAVLSDFPQDKYQTGVRWQESAQNFAISGVCPPGPDSSLYTPQQGTAHDSSGGSGLATWDLLCMLTGTTGQLSLQVPATQSLTAAQSAQALSDAAPQGFFACGTNLSFVQGEQEFGAEGNFRLVDLAGNEVCRTLMPGETLDTVLTVNVDSDLNLNAPLQALYNGQPFFAQTAPPSSAVLDVSDSLLDFGNVAVGTRQELFFTVTNVGAGTLVGGVTLAAQGGGVFQNVSEGTFNLGAGQSQVVTVRFTPLAIGSFTGSVRLSSNGGPATVNLTGVGGARPQLTVSTTTLDFGTIPINTTSATKSFTVTNTGGDTLSGTVRYQDIGSSPPAPFALAAGQSAEFLVNVTIGSPGPFDVSLPVVSNGGNDIVHLVGTAKSFVPTAPTISNFSYMLEGVNDCTLSSGIGSSFRVDFTYRDPNGDANKAAGATVLVEFQFSDGPPGSFDGTPFSTFIGDGFSGTVQVGECFRFSSSEFVDVVHTLTDGVGHPSNKLTVRIPRPEGAS